MSVAEIVDIDAVEQFERECLRRMAPVAVAPPPTAAKLEPMAAAPGVDAEALRVRAARLVVLYQAHAAIDAVLSRTLTRRDAGACREELVNAVADLIQAREAARP